MTPPPRDFGTYVHVPFCAARCDYCDFATWTDRMHLVDDYVDAVVADLTRRALPRSTSVFVGGGTPSLLPPEAMTRILDAIDKTSDAEVTVECNPDSIDRTKLAGYADAGVNRVSIGVQSMRAHVLAELGRTHDPDNVARAVDAVRAAGIERLNVDLIYGAPGERIEDWAATLDAALALGPEHVSAYALTVEPGTPLGMAVAAGTRAAPDDDDQATKYELADDVLAAAGYEWYEISNWARPGEECRHNLLYWRGGEYAGIGCAAHGHTRDHGRGSSRRWWNVRTPERYVAGVRAGESVEAADEVLDAEASATEHLVLGLRTRDGIKVDAPRAVALGVHESLEELADVGLVTLTDDHAVLTRRGRLLAAAESDAGQASGSHVLAVPDAVAPGTR